MTNGTPEGIDKEFSHDMMRCQEVLNAIATFGDINTGWCAARCLATHREGVTDLAEIGAIETRNVADGDRDARITDRGLAIFTALTSGDWVQRRAGQMRMAAELTAAGIKIEPVPNYHAD